ncbi:hypothetical protein TNCV_4671511 [Trichonephila clavipes]|nr:hypothetical protein TNCV_4671511 [Trichonephila clavipes]
MPGARGSHSAYGEETRCPIVQSFGLWRCFAMAHIWDVRSEGVSRTISDVLVPILLPDTDLEDFDPQPGPSVSPHDDKKNPDDLVHGQPYLISQPEWAKFI